MLNSKMNQIILRTWSTVKLNTFGIWSCDKNNYFSAWGEKYINWQHKLINGGFCNWDNLESCLQTAISVGKVGAVVSGTEDSTTEMLLHLHGHRF